MAGKINIFSLSKSGKIKLGIVLTLIGLILVTVFVGAFSIQENYYLGEDLRVDLRGKGNYTARFITPSKTLLKEGSNDLFLYELNELGKYEIKFKFEEESENYFFEVVEEGIIEKEEEINETASGFEGEKETVDNQIKKKIEKKEKEISEKKIVLPIKKINQEEITGEVNLKNSSVFIGRKNIQKPTLFQTLSSLGQVSNQGSRPFAKLDSPLKNSSLVLEYPVNYSGNFVNEDEKIKWKSSKEEVHFYKIKNNLNKEFLEKSPSNSKNLRYVDFGPVGLTEMAAYYELPQHNEMDSTIFLYTTNEDGFSFYGTRDADKDLNYEKINMPVARFRTVEKGPGSPVIFANKEGVFSIDFYDRRVSENPDYYLEMLEKAYDDVLLGYGIELKSTGSVMYYLDGLKPKVVGRMGLDGDYIKLGFYLESPLENPLFVEGLRTYLKSFNFFFSFGGLKELDQNIDYSFGEEIIQKFAENLEMNLEKDNLSLEENQIVNSLKEELSSESWTRYARGTKADDSIEKFEVEIILNEKPSTNIFEYSLGAENLEFYYQPTLSENQLERGDFRSEEYLGSYSVYSGNKKAFHIYRPLIIDSLGKEVWGEMEIDEENNLLRIIVPESFLENASYPVRVDPTFGYETAGGSTATLNDNIRGSVLELSEGGIITDISAYLTIGKNSDAVFKFAIYNSSGSLLGYTSEGSASGGAYSAVTNWYTLSLTGDIALPPGDYILVAWGDITSGSNDVEIHFDSGSTGQGQYQSSSYASSFPSTLSPSSENRIYSIHADYDLPTTDITLNSPSDQSLLGDYEIEFSYTPTTDTFFHNCSLWDNSTGMWHLNQTNSTPISNGLTNKISKEFVSLGSYSWNIQCCSELSGCKFSPSNRSFEIRILPKLELDLIYPFGNTGVIKNEFFKVDLNVSCLEQNCGLINVSLLEYFDEGIGIVENASTIQDSASDAWSHSYNNPEEGDLILIGLHNRAATVSSITYGGVIPTLIASSADDWPQTYLYAISSNNQPTRGESHDLEISWSSSNPGASSMLKLSGVNSEIIENLSKIVSEVNYAPSSSSISTSITPEEENSFILDIVTGRESGPNFIPGIEQSLLYYDEFQSPRGAGSSYKIFGPLIETSMSWSGGQANNRIRQVVAAIAPRDLINLLSTSVGDTPLYTNNSNPFQISSLNAGENQIVSFFVNASGQIGSNHTLFSTAKLDAYPSVSDSTDFWNITIVEYVPPVIIDLHNPSGNLGDPTPLLNLTLSGSQADSLWYNLNDSTNVSICTSCSGNIFQPIFVDSEGTFELNVYANNSNGEIESESSIFNIDLNNNFYDSFEDNHSVLNYDSGIFWEEGSLNYSGSVLTSNFYDFELGDLGDDWEFYSSNAYSRIGVRDEDSYSGSYSVIADSYSNNEYELSELISTYDYSGTQNFILDFWYKEESDENDGGSDHSGHQNADAVYFTCDGNYWYHLYNLFGTDTWQEVTLDIGSDPNFCSEVNSSFAIKFTQYDNFGLTSDGIMWDDINITYDGSGFSTSESRIISMENVIAEFTNISWNYGGDNGEVNMQISANNGTDWYDATNNQGLVSLNAGNDLKYKVLFEGSGYVDIALLDLNVSWSNTASPPPTITINSPSSGAFPDVTPVLDINLDSMANNLWYKLNGGSEIPLCSSCSGEQIKTLYLEEGSYTLVVYADNSVGDTNSETVSFTIDMDGNYYDSFSDDSQIWSLNGPQWMKGNVSYQDRGIGGLVYEPFDNMSAWTPTGGSWSIVDGEMVYSSNDGDPGVFSIYDGLEMEAGKGYNISFTAYDDDNDENALVFRYKDASNHYKCAFELQDLASSEHGLIKFDDGTMTVLDTDATKTYTQDAYNDYAVKIEDNNITCYLNDEAVFSAIDSTWEDGQVGVYSDYHQDVRYDNFSVVSWATDLVSFVSYPITLTSNIVEILNVSWKSYFENSDNSISIQVSPNDGTNWYDAVNGQGLGSINLGKNLVYRVIFDSVDDSKSSLLDINITWTHIASPPPIIDVTNPGTIVKDTTPIIKTSLSGPAEFYWYTINDGSKNVICEDCTGNQDVLILLEEGDYEIDFYANNSVGTESTNSISFEVDLERNYFDSFLDSSQIAINDSVIFNLGNLSYVGNGNIGIYDEFERSSLGDDWINYSSLASGVVEISNYVSHSGSKSVAFYTNAAGTNTLNELITNKDFTGTESINLNFWYFEEEDENTAGADHSGHYNGDAVYFTCDGNYWHHLMDFTGTTGWQEVDINVSNDPDYCSEINSNFAIKFAQYDNWDLGSDGILIDDVNISVPGGRATLRSHPINVSQNIRRIANISWEEVGTNSNNKIYLNLSVDGGNNWFEVTNGESVEGFSEGSSLVYDVLFDLNDFVEVSLLYLNITWEEPPSVKIEYPENNYVYNYPINKMNYSVSVSGSETLDTCWYTDDEGATNYTVICEEDIPMNSTDGVNKWRVYANDSSGAVGSDYVQFIIDTSAPSIVFINQTSSPVDEGSDFTVNLNVTDSNTDSVWIVIWENVIGGVQKFSGFLNNVFGDLFNTNIPIDSTYNLTHNYTIYANDTTGLESNYTGFFDVLKAWFVSDFNPIYSDGTNPAYISGELELSDGTNLVNHPINIWFENELVPIENLTGNGVYQDVFNFTGHKDIFNKSYSENVSYNGTFATLSGSNTSGLMMGIMDAGALVSWESVNWDLLTDSCSDTVIYYGGNEGYSGTMDTYIESSNPTTNYGVSQSLLLDTSPDIQRILLKFDEIFGYGKNKIPYSSTISSANMHFNVYDTGNAFNVYEILENWKENEATYNGRLAGVSWSSTGVAGSPSRSTTSLGTISATTVGTKSLSVTDLISSWNNHSKENYGVVMEPGGSSGVMIRSSEYTVASDRPSLEVSFSSSECAGIEVYVRTSRDKIIWSDWEELFIGESINDSFGMSRYLEYKIVFGSYDGIIKPNLWDIEFNYTAISTDSSGRYNYSYTTPSTFGTYDLNLSSGYRTIFAKEYLELKVQSGIDPVVELLNPSNDTWFNYSNVSFYYNATDLNHDLDSSILYVDGINVSYNQSPLIEGVNEFNHSFLEGEYLWSIKVLDSGGLYDLSENRTMGIDLTDPSVTLNYPPHQSTFTAGYLNLSFVPEDNLAEELVCNVTLDSVNIYENELYFNGSLVNVSSGALSGGLHYWNVTCVDEAGRKINSETREFNISDTPPTLNLISPFSGYLSSVSDVNFTFIPDDNSGITSCELLIDGIYKNNITNPILNKNATILATNILEGFHNWTVRCFDLSSTEVIAPNRSIGIDLNSPTIEIFFPNDGHSTNDASSYFDIRINDTIDSEISCNLTIDGNVSDSFNATSGQRFNFTSSIIDDGTHSWFFNCSDDVGHSNTSISRSITISEPPEVSLNISNNTHSSGSSFSIYYIPTDNGEINSCSVYLNGALNQTSSSVNNGVQNLFDLDNLGDGIYDYYVTCQDGIGLEDSTETNRFIIDNVAPTIYPWFPLNEDVYSVNITFNFTGDDSLSEELNCSIFVDSEIKDSNIVFSNYTNVSRIVSGINDGTHDWHLTCYDLAGNFNNSETHNFTRYTAPGVNSIYPENNSWINESDFQFIYFPQDDAGFQKTELYLNGAWNMDNETSVVDSANNSFNISLSDGIYDWYVRVVDSTGMPANSETRRVYVDTENPVLNLGLPSQDETYDNNSVRFNFTANDNLDDFLSCDLYIGEDLEWSGEVLNNSEQITNILLVDGNHSYRVKCRDNASNEVVSSEVNFTVYAPPIIELINPVNESSFYESVLNFSYIPYDALGLIECKIYLDGNLEDTSSSVVENVLNNFTIPGIPEGVHNWSVECTDNDLNTVMSNYSYFSRDITPPEIVLDVPLNESGIDFNRESITFRWKAVDSFENFMNCDLYIDDNLEVNNKLVNNDTFTTEIISGISFGEHNWNVSCWDSVNNTGFSSKRFFNYTYPDFFVNGSKIIFNVSEAKEGEEVLINASIENLGYADSENVLVQFFEGNPFSGGTQFGENHSININWSDSFELTGSFFPDIGLNEIYVVVDYYDDLTEFEENNNLGNKNLSVGSWQFFYGELNRESNFALAGEGDLISWNVSSFEDGSIFVADKESSISWLDLLPLGEDIFGSGSTGDFAEADSLLSMTGNEDSIENLYVGETESFLVFGSFMESVPITNSTNNSNFVTGILWDSLDDLGNREFDSSDEEDLVFVTKVNEGSQGAYGFYDYELRVPAKLREYAGEESEVVFYVELF